LQKGLEEIPGLFPIWFKSGRGAQFVWLFFLAAVRVGKSRFRLQAAKRRVFPGVETEGKGRLKAAMRMVMLMLCMALRKLVLWFAADNQ
jgi:phosphatidylglycerophosphate synthase